MAWTLPGRSGTVVQTVIKVELDEELSVLDVYSGAISIPRLGVKSEMDDNGEMSIINIPKIGTIVSTPSSTKPCPLFTKISYKPIMRLFKDTSTHNP